MRTHDKEHKLPPEVEKVKRQLTFGKVMVLAAYSKSKVVSAAMTLALEIEKLSKLPIRGIDMAEMVQKWSIDKTYGLADYAGAMGAPVLVLAHYGADFRTVYDNTGYRQDELHNWMKLHMRRRIKDNLVTVIAGNLQCDMKAMPSLFGECSDLAGRFIYVNMGGAPENAELSQGKKR